MSQAGLRGAGEGEGRRRFFFEKKNSDGFHEVHVNIMEGLWSLLRTRLCPHRGISQEKRPIYLGFFQFIHNARKKGLVASTWAVTFSSE